MGGKPLIITQSLYNNVYPFISLVRKESFFFSSLYHKNLLSLSSIDFDDAVDFSHEPKAREKSESAF